MNTGLYMSNILKDSGDPDAIRTRDTLIKSQVFYTKKSIYIIILTHIFRLNIVHNTSFLDKNMHFVVTNASQFPMSLAFRIVLQYFQNRQGHQINKNG